MKKYVFLDYPNKQTVYVCLYERERKRTRKWKTWSYSLKLWMPFGSYLLLSLASFISCCLCASTLACSVSALHVFSFYVVCRAACCVWCTVIYRSLSLSPSLVCMCEWVFKCLPFFSLLFLGFRSVFSFSDAVCEYIYAPFVVLYILWVKLLISLLVRTTTARSSLSRFSWIQIGLLPLPFSSLSPSPPTSSYFEDGTHWNSNPFFGQ